MKPSTSIVLTLTLSLAFLFTLTHQTQANFKPQEWWSQRLIASLPPQAIATPQAKNTYKPSTMLAAALGATSLTTPTPAPSAAPTPMPTNQTVKDFILEEINKYRRSLGLAEVSSDPYTCKFAAIRAEEIADKFDHNGFNTRVGNRTLPYPDYSLVTENIAMTGDYRRVVMLWIKSPGHAANMQKDTPFVCVEKYGNYYAYEGWSL